jgi:uncharacterized OB-fold protein
MPNKLKPLSRPAKKFISVGEEGRPRITGFRCADCGAVALENTVACRRCGSRNPLEEFTASQSGHIYTFTVVERSFPGVSVPFVSVIVDLDDGLTLKGTLREADRDSVSAGMPVKLVFDDAGGAKDDEGVPYVGYHFLASTGDEK